MHLQRSDKDGCAHGEETEIVQNCANFKTTRL